MRSEWIMVAERQAGVISASQLAEAGVTRSDIQRLLGDGAVRRAGRGVYHLAGGPLDWMQSVWLRLLLAGSGAFACRRTAAQWWGFDGAPTGFVDIAVGPGHQSRRPGVARLHSVSPDDVLVSGQLPVTSVARTLLDLGDLADDLIVERGLEWAFRRHEVTPAQIEALIARPRTAGARRLAAVVGHRPGGAAGTCTESDAETLFWQLVRAAGLPTPERQFQVVVKGRNCRLDFAWPDIRLAAEVDGFGVHGRPAALDSDLRRQNGLVLDGWVVIRFTWTAIVQTPNAVIADLRRAWQARAGVER